MAAAPGAAGLGQQLVRLRWPSEAQAVRWTLLECGELAAPQLGLFGKQAPAGSVLAEVVGSWVGGMVGR